MQYKTNNAQREKTFAVLESFREKNLSDRYAERQRLTIRNVRFFCEASPSPESPSKSLTGLADFQLILNGGSKQVFPTSQQVQTVACRRENS